MKKANLIYTCVLIIAVALFSGCSKNNKSITNTSAATTEPTSVTNPKGPNTKDNEKTAAVNTPNQDKSSAANKATQEETNSKLSNLDNSLDNLNKTLNDLDETKNINDTDNALN